MHNGVLLDPPACSGMMQAPIENVAAELPLLLMAVAIGFSFAAVGYVHNWATRRGVHPSTGTRSLPRPGPLPRRSF